MKNIGNIMGKVCLGALAAWLIPYRIKLDKETGALEVGSLLWNVKKTPGEERDTYTIELLPLFRGKEYPTENGTPAADASAAPAAPVESEGSN